MVKLSLINKDSQFANKRAQIWGTDLLVAAMIFSLAITFFYIYTINNSAEAGNEIEDLAYEGGVISDTLLSSGHPEDWNETNVIELGILKNGKIDDLKLELFYNLTQNNYSYTKSVLNTPYDFYFKLDENMTILSSIVKGFGKPGTNLSSLNSENLIMVKRVTIYNDKLMGASLYIWS